MRYDGVLRIPVATIAQQNAVREQIAAQLAEFESRGGKAEFVPIIVGRDIKSSPQTLTQIKLARKQAEPKEISPRQANRIAGRERRAMREQYKKNHDNAIETNAFSYQGSPCDLGHTERRTKGQHCVICGRNRSRERKRVVTAAKRAAKMQSLKSNPEPST